jgi:hypothetical protein
MEESYVSREEAILYVTKLLKEIKAAKELIHCRENEIKKLSKEYGLNIDLDNYSIELKQV